MTDTVLSLRREWSRLQPSSPDDLLGDWEGTFVAPLRRVAPAGLGVLGLPRWYGKRFRRVSDRVEGINLLRASSGLEETMPMTLTLGISLVDGLPTLLVQYPPSTRRPWPWVRDELRARPDGSLVAMTVVDLPLLRRTGGTPFLLARR